MSEENRTLAVRAASGLSMMEMGRVFHESGYFKDARSAAQAIVKIQAGAEVGLPPVASMTGIYIVQDKVTFSAVTMAALIKKARRYTYRVKEMTDQACEIEFFEATNAGEHWQSIGLSRFTMEDAKKAQLSVKGIWQQYPRNMLFSRALSNGARWFTPDIFGGPVYTPDELGAEVIMDSFGEMKVLADPIGPAAGEPPEVLPSTPVCHDCGSEIYAIKDYSAEAVAQLTQKAWGVPLCHNCHSTRKIDRNAQKKAAQADYVGPGEEEEREEMPAAKRAGGQ